jgi:hypothetical protein
MAQNKTKANVLSGEQAKPILDRDGATSTPPFFGRRDRIQGGEHVFVDAELGRSHLIRGTASRERLARQQLHLLCGGFGRLPFHTQITRAAGYGSW